ncbi:BRE1-domain-containing protein [Athelia psychrophila]|uniref:E3 ubiquitin protein ligase n=1 Tax=Athelia psychrophila TaxID=1759441 RepID=A0A166WXT7_9AGAM|nr:BRE1-domain-containing protein [Fibularhizoctonia sp. CBS 109695]
MMESRKRPHSTEDEPTIQKKRILTGVNGGPHVNVVVSEAEEPKEGDDLELFRKEAIFRRMKHYSREHERSQAQIAQLEKRRSTCEAGMAAMAACWEQLVTAIRTLARPEDLPSAGPNTKGRLFDLTEHIDSEDAPALKIALEDNMQTTQQLITSFMQMGMKSQPNALHDRAYQDCQKAQNECLALRSEMSLVRKQLRASEEQNQQYRADLAAAETRADRLQSRTVQAIEARSPEEKQEQRMEESEERKSNSSASPAPPQINGGNQLIASEDLESLQAITKSREQNIVTLEGELAKCREELLARRMEMKAPSHEFVMNTPSFRFLLELTSKLEHEAKEAATEMPRLREEVQTLQHSRKEWETSVLAATETAKDEFRIQLSRREAESLRLREQRDQQAAELIERKNKDNVKMTSLNELKSLAESRSERILVLQSELKRCKTQLAAEAGSEELLAFFAQENSGDISYVEDLKTRVAAAEARAAALEQSVAKFAEDHPEAGQHASAEAEARQQLSDVTKQLEKYRSVYGDSSSLPPDVQGLSQELQRKEEEVKKLRLLETQRAEAESSLYAELDKLSAAWEALDRQVKSKVFDLTSMEERLAKMGHDRAKSENKFYAAMRDKESIETERKNLSRNLEKQAKAVEKLVESERHLLQQISAFEKEVAMSHRAVEEAKKASEASRLTAAEWQNRAEVERARHYEYFNVVKTQNVSLDAKATELRKAGEELLRLRTTADKHASEFKLLSTGTSSQKEAGLQAEIDKLMALLKCSTCKMHMRSTVITKCMHTFCRHCVDARISTRQRKCPACNLGFAASDVQQIFFQ